MGYNSASANSMINYFNNLIAQQMMTQNFYNNIETQNTNSTSNTQQANSTENSSGQLSTALSNALTSLASLLASSNSSSSSALTSSVTYAVGDLISKGADAQKLTDVINAMSGQNNNDLLYTRTPSNDPWITLQNRTPVSGADIQSVLYQASTLANKGEDVNAYLDMVKEVCTKCDYDDVRRLVSVTNTMLYRNQDLKSFYDFGKEIINKRHYDYESNIFSVQTLVSYGANLDTALKIMRNMENTGLNGRNNMVDLNRVTIDARNKGMFLPYLFDQMANSGDTRAFMDAYMKENGMESTAPDFNRFKRIERIDGENMIITEGESAALFAQAISNVHGLLDKSVLYWSSVQTGAMFHGDNYLDLSKLKPGIYDIYVKIGNYGGGTDTAKKRVIVKPKEEEVLVDGGSSTVDTSKPLEPKPVVDPLKPEEPRPKCGTVVPHEEPKPKCGTVVPHEEPRPKPVVDPLKPEEPRPKCGTVVPNEEPRPKPVVDPLEPEKPRPKCGTVVPNEKPRPKCGTVVPNEEPKPKRDPVILDIDSDNLVKFVSDEKETKETKKTVIETTRVKEVSEEYPEMSDIDKMRRLYLLSLGRISASEAYDYIDEKIGKGNVVKFLNEIGQTSMAKKYENRSLDWMDFMLAMAKDPQFYKKATAEFRRNVSEEEAAKFFKSNEFNDKETKEALWLLGYRKSETFKTVEVTKTPEVKTEEKVKFKEGDPDYLECASKPGKDDKVSFSKKEKSSLVNSILNQVVTNNVTNLNNKKSDKKVDKKRETNLSTDILPKLENKNNKKESAKANSKELNTKKNDECNYKEVTNNSLAEKYKKNNEKYKQLLDTMIRNSEDYRKRLEEERAKLLKKENEKSLNNKNKTNSLLLEKGFEKETLKVKSNNELGDIKCLDNTVKFQVASNPSKAEKR